MDWTDSWWGLTLIAIVGFALIALGIFAFIAIMGAAFGAFFGGIAWGFCLFVNFC